MEPDSVSSDACRLCGENTEPQQMHNIFEKTEAGPQTINLIKECLPVIIFRTDPLPKHVCEACLVKLSAFYELKKTSLETAKRFISHLRNTQDDNNKSLHLYLACDGIDQNEDPNGIPHQNVETSKTTTTNTGTSSDDLLVTCVNCKSTCFDTIVNSEVELCAELHKAIADSLSINKVVTSGNDNERDKGERSTRRRRSQAFYHELDDSLCSSMTEFTNTESSQAYEDYNSEMDSYESGEENLDRAKRRRLNSPPLIYERQMKLRRDTEKHAEFQAKPQVPAANLHEQFLNSVEHRYYPLKLMTLALNEVNKKIVPGYEPYEFYTTVWEPSCTYCKKTFKNSNLLALHEVEHINIELGEKVDNPSLWHDSRDDAYVRNKWLNSFDESDTAYIGSGGGRAATDSLLIPVGVVDNDSFCESITAGEITLLKGHAAVNGILLTDYAKDERKSFYKSMKIGGVNKKFCSLCRYSFKDNWAIESHYFSLACYYTCRYCGMRFNKQRHRFDEHVKEHEELGDALSTQIYAASKLNNFVPRIIQPDKVKKMVAEHEPKKSTIGTIRVKNFGDTSSFNADLKIKEEPFYSDEEPPVLKPKSLPSSAAAKSNNQAYFCRKCYKVFFKLDEFNIHSKNCDYNQFPQGRSPKGFPNQAKNNDTKPTTKHINSNGEVATPSPRCRPLRAAAKDNNYDEDYLPSSSSREKQHSSSQQSFVCFICNTPFPTIYSRNSHMRIHKGELHKNTPPVVKTRQQQNATERERERDREKEREPTVISMANFIKQEPLEPEVHIHEPEHKVEQHHNNIGTVSITPISKNPNQKATINPNIMKLVQNNPHLTIKQNKSPERQLPPVSINNSSSSNNSQNSQHSQNSIQSNLSDVDRTYKCSSCWESFTNKSHLYFHKKNQCEGSKYPCPFCKKRFGTESAYSSHIFYSHPE